MIPALPLLYYYPPLDPPPGYVEPPVVARWREAGGAVRVVESGAEPPTWPEVLYDYDLARLSLGGDFLTRALPLLLGSAPAPVAGNPSPPSTAQLDFSEALFEDVAAECGLPVDGPESAFARTVVHLVCATLRRAGK